MLELPGMFIVLLPELEEDGRANNIMKKMTERIGYRFETGPAVKGR